MEIRFSEYSEPLFDDKESRDLDRKTILKTGISGSHLMGFAALSIYQNYRKKILRSDSVFILCGNGNNGGDGLALAFFLIQEGKESKVFLKEGSLSEESAYYKNLLLRAGGTILNLESDPLFFEGENICIIDALLGTGFQPPIRDPYGEVLEKIQKQKRKSPKRTFILSIDVISGFSENLPVPFEVDALAEIGMKKWRNRFLPNEIKKTFHRIGFPIGKKDDPNPESFGKILWKIIPDSYLKECLKRKEDSHKYKNGSLLLIGGSQGMAGAALSSLFAFHELGGGISLLLSPSEKTVRSVLKKDPSLMIDRIEDSSTVLSKPFVKIASVFLLGPGLRTDECPILDLPKDKFCVLDAGALEVYKEKILHEKVLMTPHTGELETLLNQKIKTVSEGISLAKDYAKSFRVHILWKRHSSFLIDPKGNLFVWEKTEPKLAVMGTGDLLAGILAFFLSRGFSIPNSTQLSFSLLTNAAKRSKGFPTASEIRKRLLKGGN
ncbi:bifunctional ADP-dependent NAD(P)H-hydrate dehydratase/NAD(P)H-hydrate epimerase [Leptospira sp. 201903070]|uniref:Bifunctional NAD(P)H-hydrate repair enzyme n=1 Tax=Leptospira ainlahdjerensis TaxID=2810033 RepID=A0ABS2U6P4_9LEPT|nr:bifunctional ADP-dependent NAD(P)H-hydrate dehydratase/NAD(P)H-hydrate epimerase [Leptospira ainlahdjerensis]MBM9576042.1 bifunctional ADP-dependent NAD(P)H-hydrate dehydratase/NAD(P)H-hydrate epimerase [Leptospira ainlahdjerensis]